MTIKDIGPQVEKIALSLRLDDGGQRGFKTIALEMELAALAFDAYMAGVESVGAALNQRLRDTP